MSNAIEAEKQPLLKAHNLNAGYGLVSVLESVSIEVFAGEIVTIIGANGAGKTTLLRTLSRLIPATSGEINFSERNLLAVPAYELPKLGIAHVPEGRQIFSRLSVQENLFLGAYSRPQHKPTLAVLERALTLFPVLKDRLSQLGGTLSGGEQQMLAIARALMSEPKLLLLDEPSMGVAPILIERIFETIKALNSEGMTILLVEQNAELALSIAKRAYVIETGRVVLQGSAASIREDPKVREAYLGA